MLLKTEFSLDLWNLKVMEGHRFLDRSSILKCQTHWQCVVRYARLKCIIYFLCLIINILGSEHLLHTTELNLDLIKVQFVNTNHNMNETQCDMNVVFCLFNLKRFLLHICSRMAGWDSRLLC